MVPSSKAQTDRHRYLQRQSKTNILSSVVEWMWGPQLHWRRKDEKVTLKEIHAATNESKTGQKIVGPKGTSPDRVVLHSYLTFCACVCR